MDKIRAATQYPRPANSCGPGDAKKRPPLGCPAPALGRDLYRFLDLAATDATGADTDPARRAVDQGPDGLQIRSKYPSRSVIGMADIIAGGMMLPAHLADPGHSSAPL
jgi:hypothetical protein